MKNILVLLILTTLPALSHAAEFGIAGAIGTSAELRLPIKINNFVVEPYLSHLVSKQSEEGDVDNERSEDGVGIALWRLLDLNDNTYFQYGAQLGYQTTETKSGYLSFSESGESGSTYSEKLDGYVVAPGIGLFYAFNNQFEIGLEVKYRYTKLSGEQESTISEYPDYTWTPESTLSVSETSSWLQSQAVVRLFF